MSKLITCKSCGNKFRGKYCNICGEKVIDQNDRRFKQYIGDFINALTFADNKLLRSLKSILLSPGQLSKDFVNGKRKPYMKPASIFFLANLVYFLFPLINTFTTDLNIQTRAFPYSPLADKWVQQTVEKRGLDFKEYEKKYDQKTTELSKLLIIVMAVMLALFFWPIHLGSEKRLVADHMAIGLEVMSFVLLFCMMGMGIVFLVFGFFGYRLFSDTIITSIILIMLTYFFIRMEYTYYGFKGIRSMVNTVLCLVSIGIALYAYRALLFFITFWSI